MWPHGCSGRRRPRPPARLGDLTSFGAAPRSPPVPSGPSGALHTGGAGCADDCLGVSSRSPARPWRRVACSVGLGRCVCRWAAARPRDRHTRACGSEWSISKPARALRTLRRPLHRWGRGGLQSGGTWCACTWPGPAATHGHRGQDYSQPSHNKRSEKPRPLQWLRSLCHGFPTMSHAIPPPLF